MNSPELYHIKQQFFLGAYKTLISLTLPDPNSPAYVSTLLYQTRAYIALDNPESALELIPTDTENVAIKAAAALARYILATQKDERDAINSSLEEIRDLAVEIEGDDTEGSEAEKALVRVLAGTAFARAGEVEEALETLGVDTEDLEAVAVIVHIYLTINRPDLAKKQFERSKRWAEDDLLLQLIESTIGLVTGKDGYANASSFYTEQLGNPSLSSPHILTSRGVTRILRNEVREAKSDLDEALEQQKNDAETMAALVVAAGLGATKASEAEELWIQLCSAHPDHPLVMDVKEKESLFDECASKFEVPPMAA